MWQTLLKVTTKLKNMAAEDHYEVSRMVEEDYLS